MEFQVDVHRTDHYTASGSDEVEFLISTNPGSIPPRPLGEVASGGELSRIMLAIKTVLADTDDIPTLIFDEIDTGISGRTAQKVSERLKFCDLAEDCDLLFFPEIQLSDRRACETSRRRGDHGKSH